MVQVKEPFTFYTPERQRGGERGREEMDRLGEERWRTGRNTYYNRGKERMRKRGCR